MKGIIYKSVVGMVLANLMTACSDDSINDDMQESIRFSFGFEDIVNTKITDFLILL